jgi:sterol desaturase/sphingolipid hydroxylase (fatty acid hydroxylase superfamily)
LSKIFLFALTAALNPTLLTATTVMLLLPNPKRLMLGYLAGAYTTGVIVGFAIVQWLHGSDVVSTTKHSVSPAIDVALGAIALIAAWVIRSGRIARAKERREQKRGDRPKKTPKWQQALSGGTAKTTFLVGLLLSFPGASYLAALTQIDKQGWTTATELLVIVAVNVVMLVLLEVPLLAFAVAPERTPAAIESFKSWLAWHGARALTIALTLIGAALILRGVLTVLVS